MLQEDLFYETSDKDSAASGLERVTFEQLPAATRTQTRRQKHARFNTTAHYTKAKQRHDETQIGLLEAHSEEDGAVFKVCRICMLRVFIIIIIKVHVCAVCIHTIVYSYCISNICITFIVIGSGVAQCKGPHFQIYSYISCTYTKLICLCPFPSMHVLCSGSGQHPLEREWNIQGETGRNKSCMSSPYYI